MTRHLCLREAFGLPGVSQQAEAGGGGHSFRPHVLDDRNVVVHGVVYSWSLPPPAHMPFKRQNFSLPNH